MQMPMSVAQMTMFGAVNEVVKIKTEDRVSLYNITDRIGEFIHRVGLQDGIVIVSSLHTTTALFLNEYQDALLMDMKQVLESLVKESEFYYHNCDDYSDCERKNATAHLRAMLLGHQVVVPVEKGQLAIGTWQSVILAELDGPRTRRIHLHALGQFEAR